MSKRYLLYYFCCSTIHSSQEIELTFTSIGRWMYKVNMFHINSGILFSARKDAILPSVKA
jgi:hypothetical protein